MDSDDAARFDPPAAARQKEDIHRRFYALANDC
jgi:hypothetical protein